MRRVLFLTTNAGKHAEIAALFARECDFEVERRTATLPIPPSVIPGEVARFRALAAFGVLRNAVFAEALAIELADGLVSGASYRQAFEQPGGSSWLKKHDGAPGIARIAVGYTADGAHAHVFESAIQGHLSAVPTGVLGTAAWERHWIPTPPATLPDPSPYLSLASLLRTD